ncbi:MAG: hypothetical protein CVV27_00900, partial [Candidatus Melainabacteria bacterium HGW-Melainabacteria-1]
MQDSLLQETKSQFKLAPFKNIKLLLLSTGVTLVLNAISHFFVVCLIFLLIILGMAPQLAQLGDKLAHIGLFSLLTGLFSSIGFMTASLAILRIDGRLRALLKLPVLRILGLSGLTALPFLPIAILTQVIAQQSEPLIWLGIAMGLLFLLWISPILMLAVARLVWGMRLLRPKDQTSSPSSKQLMRITAGCQLGLLLLLALAAMLLSGLDLELRSKTGLWLALLFVFGLSLPCL